MNTKQTIEDELGNRIEAMKNFLVAAQECLDEKNYLQCAARLEMAAEQGKFPQFMMDIFDSESGTP